MGKRKRKKGKEVPPTHPHHLDPALDVGLGPRHVHDARVGARADQDLDGASLLGALAQRRDLSPRRHVMGLDERVVEAYGA